MSTTPLIADPTRFEQTKTFVKKYKWPIKLLIGVIIVLVLLLILNAIGVWDVYWKTGNDGFVEYLRPRVPTQFDVYRGEGLQASPILPTQFDVYSRKEGLKTRPALPTQFDVYSRKEGLNARPTIPTQYDVYSEGYAPALPTQFDAYREELAASIGELNLGDRAIRNLTYRPQLDGASENMANRNALGKKYMTSNDEVPSPFESLKAYEEGLTAYEGLKAYENMYNNNNLLAYEGLNELKAYENMHNNNNLVTYEGLKSYENLAGYEGKLGRYQEAKKIRPVHSTMTMDRNRRLEMQRSNMSDKAAVRDMTMKGDQMHGSAMTDMKMSGRNEMNV